MVMVGLWLVTGCLLSAGRLAELREGDSGYAGSVDGGGTTDGGTDGGSTSIPELDWVVVPAGTFTMGCTAGQSDCESDELPTTEVTLTRSFYLSTTEVTQAVYEAVMGDNPSSFEGCPTCPVEYVRWYEAASFANALSSVEGLDLCYVIDGEDVSWPDGLDCTGYRLPTEAEWEYAARAGEDTLYAGGDNLDELGWYDDNSDSTMPVAGKVPNAWGLYDMSGNVWEWTWDLYDAYPGGTVEDPLGASTGSFRVYRGGGWGNSPQGARLAIRGGFTPGTRFYNLGLRLARSIP